MSDGAERETMDREQCVEDVRIMAQRVALLYHAFVTTLVDRFDETEARAITREAIERYGTRIGRDVREIVEGQGLPNAVENYGQGKGLPSVGWEGGMAETEDGPRRRVTYCPLAATWQALDFESLGRLYCGVDQAKYRAYNAQAELVHTCNVLDGDPYCEFDIRLHPDGEPGADDETA